MSTIKAIIVSALFFRDVLTRREHLWTFLHRDTPEQPMVGEVFAFIEEGGAKWTTVQVDVATSPVRLEAWVVVFSPAAAPDGPVVVDGTMLDILAWVPCVGSEVHRVQA